MSVSNLTNLLCGWKIHRPGNGPGPDHHWKRWDGQIHDFALMAEYITVADPALREADGAARLALHAE